MRNTVIKIAAVVVLVAVILAGFSLAYNKYHSFRVEQDRNSIRTQTDQQKQIDTVVAQKDSVIDQLRADNAKLSVGCTAGLAAYNAFPVGAAKLKLTTPVCPALAL